LNTLHTPKVIFIGATGLVRNGKDRIVPDKETATACEDAANLQNRTHHDHVLVAAAGDTIFVPHKSGKGEVIKKLVLYLLPFLRVPPLGLTVWMAETMKDHVKWFNPAAEMKICKAREFTTSGEMDALAQFCYYSHTEEVVLVVKKSQAFRMKLLCRHWLKHYNCMHMTVSVVTFRNSETWMLYELLALCKDITAMGARRAYWVHEAFRDLTGLSENEYRPA
jgi:hypothetical protein